MKNDPMPSWYRTPHLETKGCHVNSTKHEEKGARTALNKKAQACHLKKTLQVNPLPYFHSQDKF
jgi:hypothetical protein